MSIPEHIDAAVRRAEAMQDDLRRSDRAQLLEAIAAALESRRDEIIGVCSQETALTPEELAPEFARMSGTLRLFARTLREGSWVNAAIDTTSPLAIGPGHDVRRMLVPLDGVVAVFGASNFPLAYGVCGGDTASALAAGCPVVVKEHPAHPRTGRLLAEIANAAVAQIVTVTPVEWNSPDNRTESVIGHSIAYVNDPSGDTTVGANLVRCRDVCAVGFTGSREGGMALDAVARERMDTDGRSVPAYSEMGSANRVVIYPHALANRGKAIAAELAASILSRHGQQCTKPGLIRLPHDPAAGPAFVAELARLMDAAPPRRMVSLRVANRYVRQCRRLREVPALARVTTRADPETVVDGELRTVPMLFAAMDVEPESTLASTPESEGFWANEEIFGPAAIVLGTDAGSIGWTLFWNADASLATTVFADPLDIQELLGCADDTGLPYIALVGGLIRTGRLTFNTVPTGVRVCHAMVHGGPFPATNRPDTTAVGPYAIERWCRPVCFQNCSDQLLPPELQDANPLGIERIVNGVRTREPVKRG